MNLICPNCGKVGGDKNFQMLGQQKILCHNCKAVLKIALKCPACGGIMALPFHALARTSRLMRILNVRFLFHSNRRNARCPVCDYEAEFEKFDRVVVFKEEFSVIM